MTKIEKGQILMKLDEVCRILKLFLVLEEHEGN